MLVGMAPTAEEVMKRISEAIGRGKGRFGLGSVTKAQAAMAGSSAPYSLTVGSCSMVRTRVKGQEGFLVSIGMNRDHIQELRDQCDAALTALDAQTS
jgi:hypothetical protein